MSYTLKNNEDDSLNDSWIHLNSCDESFFESQPVSSSTPNSSYMNMGKLEKLLLDAQRESSQSSLVGSGLSSKRGSPKTPCTPKSPPSPILTESLSEEFPGIVVSRLQGSTDWIWDWSSSPDQTPPKGWKLLDEKQVKCGFSFRKSKVLKSGLFSAETLSVLIVTNVLSILIGAGIGLYVSKKAGSVGFSLTK